MKRSYRCCWLIFLLAITSLSHVQGQQPVLPFQGQLTDQTGLPLPSTTPLTLVFRIYESPVGGTVLWEETQPNVVVIAGRFSVLLGSRSPLPNTSQFSKTLYLGITVDDGDAVTADVEMRPRQAILPVVFATNSGNAEKLAGRDWSSLLVNGSNDPSLSRIRTDKLDLDAIIKRLERLEKISLPIGTILAWSGTDLSQLGPGVWMICNGKNDLSKTDYAELFAIIGNTWGTGSSATTFKLPDLTSRFLRGAYAGNPVGTPQPQGTKLPKEEFTITGGGHSHTYTRQDGIFKLYNGYHTNDAGSHHPIARYNYITDTISGGSHTHAISGGDSETRPVNAVVNWIIRVK